MPRKALSLLWAKLEIQYSDGKSAIEILLTGGVGYVCSHMVMALVERRDDVVLVDILSTGMWWAILPEATLVDDDIGYEVLLDRIIRQHKFDAVAHFAGSILAPESVGDPLGYYLNNSVKSCLRMARAVRVGIPRFIFSSITAVNGDVPADPVFEDRLPSPV